MVVSKKLSQNLVSIGFSGAYDGSVFQEMVEEIRMNLENPDDSSTWDIGQFFGESAIIDGKEYAVFFEDGTEIPSVTKPISKLPKKKKKEIDKREELEKERKKLKPLKPIKKKPLPKPLPKPKDKPKDKPKPKSKDKDYAKEIRGLISDLRQDVKDGLITKKFYMERISELTKKLNKGGKI